jgi:hypothetical protein
VGPTGRGHDRQAGGHVRPDGPPADRYLERLVRQVHFPEDITPGHDLTASKLSSADLVLTSVNKNGLARDYPAVVARKEQREVCNVFGLRYLA